MTVQIRYRPICDDDRESLYSIYASTRIEELAQFPWSEAQKIAFLRMQFQAQHAHYHQQYPIARFELILLDGEIAGRLYVNRSEQEIRIVDIALLSEYRGAGTGGSILRDLMAEARAAGKPLSLSVEFNNPAQRLYQRLGFQTIGEEWPYRHMAWSAPREPIGSPGNADHV